MPGLLRAGRGLRPRVGADTRRAPRRTVRRQRPEGLVVVRTPRRLVHPRHAERPGRSALPGADVPARRHALAGRRGAAADTDHGRGRVQRDLLRRRRGPRRERDRRARTGLAGGDDDADARAGGARIRALGGVRGRGRQAARPGPRPRARRSAPRPDRGDLDRAPGAEVDELPRADAADGDGCSGAGGFGAEAALVGGEPAARQARARAARPGGAGDGTATATGSGSSCAAAATRSRPGPRRSSGTSSPSACSGCRRGAEGCTSPSRRNRRRCARRRGAGSTSGIPPERVAELADSEAGWDPASWAELAELGWLGVSVAEDEGGAGLGFLEEAVLFEELGRALYPGPYFSTVALALPAARHRRPRRRRRRRGPLVGAGGRARSRSRARRAGGHGRRAGRRPRARPSRRWTRRRRLGRLATAVGRRRQHRPAARCGRRSRSRRSGSRSARSTGASSTPRSVSSSASRSASTRRCRTRSSTPSWRPSCALARLLGGVVRCRGRRAGAAAAAAAKAYAAEAAVSACERSIQVHGGIGFTWEHPLHRYYKRAQWIQAFDGFPAASAGGGRG